MGKEENPKEDLKDESVEIVAETAAEVAVDDVKTVLAAVPEVSVEPSLPLTVKGRVPGFRKPVLKLYKRLEFGERITKEEFARRLKLTDPLDIQAASNAWHFMRDEGKVAGEQFYKPPAKD